MKKCASELTAILFIFTTKSVKYILIIILRKHCIRILNLLSPMGQIFQLNIWVYG